MERPGRSVTLAVSIITWIGSSVNVCGLIPWKQGVRQENLGVRVIGLAMK